MASTSAPARAVFQVHELVASLRHGLEMTFPSVWVEGEIGSFTAARSGHWYFTLKDADAQLRCVFFRYQRGALPAPAEGQTVVIRAKPGIYPQRGELQLVVDHLEAGGEGALRRAFELLKAKLEAEGLFADDGKRPVPAQPRVVGLITSRSGAVLHDIVTTVRRRNPLLRLILYPASVQGPAAVPELVRALDTARRRDEVDTLILARGGGSLEDLAAFNSEELARAIAACPLPLISAVGHETDVTIADFVADERAPTPTAAAERVSRDMHQHRVALTRDRATMLRAVRRLIGSHAETLGRIDRWLAARHPQRQLGQHAQRLDELGERLRRQGPARLRGLRTQLANQRAILRSRAPSQRLHHARIRHADLLQRLCLAATTRLSRERDRVSGLVQRQRDLSPDRTLARGYSIAWQHGRVLSDSSKTDFEAPIRLQLASGELEVTAEDTPSAKQ